MIDARAQILCRLGGASVSVISGETSDSFLQMAGLVVTTGRLTLAGLHPAAIGTTVDLAWVRGGYVGRLPRPRLRVVRCTVDPLRRQTDLELGDLFALKSGVRATDPLGLVSPTSATQQTYEADALVRAAMSRALGFDPGPTGITGRVWGDFDWKNGYLPGAGEVLLSFGRFAYLTPDEGVAFGDLASPSLSGAEVALNDLIDLRPLTGGTRPGAIAIGVGQVRTLAANSPDSEGGSTTTRDAVVEIPRVKWSVGLAYGVVSSSYTPSGYGGTRISAPYAWNLPRMSLDTTYAPDTGYLTIGGDPAMGVINNSVTTKEPVSYQITSTTTRQTTGNRTISTTETYDLVAAISTAWIVEPSLQSYNVSLDWASRLADVLNVGSTLTPVASPIAEARAVFPPPGTSPTARILRTRERTEEVRNEDGTSSTVSQTFITYFERDLHLANTTQQFSVYPFDTAAATDAVTYDPGVGSPSQYSSLACEYLASETRTTTTNIGGRSETRTVSWDFRSGVSTTVSWSRALTPADTAPPATENYTTQFYRAQVLQINDGYLDSEVAYVCPCVIVDNPEGAYSQFGTVQNRLAYGYRLGLQLQSAIGVLPTTPGAMFHLTTDGQTGTYRVNGLAVAFDNQQLLVSMDALYWGASA